MAIILTLLLSSVVSYVLWNCQSLYSNYQSARKSGYPILICPANPNNILWMIFSVAFRPILARFLPGFIYRQIIPAIYGWEFLSRYEIFARLGSSFILVTPGKNEFWVADPETAHSILARRNDFLQSDVGSRIMGLFGPNVITAEGDDWKRQRKIVAPILNERISQSVWKESSMQAREMLDSFTTKPAGEASSASSNRKAAGETNATIQGVRSIAINVLGAVGYGTPKSWSDEAAKAPPGYQLSYLDSIMAVVENLVPATFVPVKLLTSPIMPPSIQRIGFAVKEFPHHVDALLKSERSSSHSNTNNLMSTLVKVSDAENDGSAGASMNKLYLSENELAGNLFQFTIAGFDTTANTMAYAITLLATYPQWQEWLFEELDQELNRDNSLEYETTYPALKRCLALMFEVLRLYTPVTHIARRTDDSQQISTGSKLYQVPANSTVYISAGCMHVNSAIWGSDALEFLPTRWLDGDSLYQPPRSSFLPWSGGPRVCPGLKMAQVEFVAVMMTIFRFHKVRPVPRDGETMEMAREKLKGVMADSQPLITLQMKRPRDVVLRWENRATS